MTESNPVSADDTCGACGTKRDEHGDKNHQFTLTDQIIPLPKPEKARNDPPRERGAHDGPSVHLALATLVEILAEKELLDTKDILRIFRGEG